MHSIPRTIVGLMVPLLLLGGCSRSKSPSPPTPTLTEARKGFKTHLVREERDQEPVATPPPSELRVVSYPGPLGPMAAYLSPDPKDGKRHPAILWVVGGPGHTIDAGVWKMGPPENDQSATIYRKRGVVTMYPSQRGGNENPGVKEGFLGEVDDLLAAAEYLKTVDYIDPQRIYLGGHSTGGTLVLLTAEMTTPFRAVFSFGPADVAQDHSPRFVPWDTSISEENRLRSPVEFLASIRQPTFVFEGTRQGRAESLETLRGRSTNPLVTFLPVEKGTHFTILAPLNQLIAQKILGDTGPTCSIAFSPSELEALLP